MHLIMIWNMHKIQYFERDASEWLSDNNKIICLGFLFQFLYFLNKSYDRIVFLFQMHCKNKHDITKQIVIPYLKEHFQ